MTRRMTQADRDDFEQYLAEMDLVLDEFVNEAREARYALDYSLKSLDALEEYWLAASPSVANPESSRIGWLAITERFSG